MNSVNEMLRRLAAGEPPNPKERDQIIMDIRKLRIAHESGTKVAKHQDDDAVNDMKKLWRAANQKDKPKTDRRGG